MEKPNNIPTKEKKKFIRSETLAILSSTIAVSALAVVFAQWQSEQKVNSRVQSAPDSQIPIQKPIESTNTELEVDKYDLVIGNAYFYISNKDITEEEKTELITKLRSAHQKLSQYLLPIYKKQ